jgi:hypothetical protein
MMGVWIRQLEDLPEIWGTICVDPLIRIQL